LFLDIARFKFVAAAQDKTGAAALGDDETYQ